MDRRRVLQVLHALVSVTLVAAAAPPAGAQAPLWGRLEAGAHAVGFTTLGVYDRARPCVPHRARGVDPCARAPGRQVRVALWYPARRGAGGAMRHLDYAQLDGDAVDLGLTGAARAELGRRVYEGRLAELGGDTARLAERAPPVYALPVAARAVAPAAAGRFPLVVFPGFPSAQTVLAEYLASHGYVVAATELLGTADAEFTAG